MSWRKSSDEPGRPDKDGLVSPADDPEIESDRLLDALAPAGKTEECDAVSAQLDQFVALGSAGPARMPEIHEHVRQCRHCSFEVTVLERVRRQMASWRDVATAVGGSGAKLQASGGVWYWLSETGRRLSKLNAEDFALGREFAGWCLQPAVAAGTWQSFAEPSLPVAIALTRPVDRLGARLRLELAPEEGASVRPPVWRARISLSGTPKTQRLRVGLIEGEGASLGWRTLGSDRAAEFSVEPPGERTYWLRLEWVDASGDTLQEKVAIPCGSSEQENV
jgi:hypothetical protein